jgi:hypothetical protein
MQKVRWKKRQYWPVSCETFCGFTHTIFHFFGNMHDDWVASPNLQREHLLSQKRMAGTTGLEPAASAVTADVSEVTD